VRSPGPLNNTFDVAVDGQISSGVPQGNERIDPAARRRLDSLERRVIALEQACVAACSPSSCWCPSREAIREHHRHVTYIDGIEVIS